MSETWWSLRGADVGSAWHASPRRDCARSAAYDYPMEQRIPTGNLSEIFASRQGEGTYCGDQHLFVRFAGCNIRCSYCDTPESLVRVATCHVDYPSGRHETHDNPLDVPTLVSITERFVREDPSIKMISLTGGEPMVQAAFIAAL